MGGCYWIAVVFQCGSWAIQWEIPYRMKQLSKPFKNEVARLPPHLFYYYILFFEKIKVWAYEQLHILEQLVYKEYLNKMRFEVSRMQLKQFCRKQF